RHLTNLYIRHFQTPPFLEIMYTLRGQKSTRGGDTVTFWQGGVESQGETSQNPVMASRDWRSKRTCPIKGISD
ncbi:MAG: hypothetical protein MUO61_05615, partial [Dehalococcoidia bacterium]|nr:hypothetical protein [Dehalococcoidia bacterium]